MNAEKKNLFPKSDKWPLWPLIPVGAFMAFAGDDVSIQDYTLVIRDGLLYVCVDVRKDQCYKVEGLPPKTEGTMAPK